MPQGYGGHRTRVKNSLARVTLRDIRHFQSPISICLKQFHLTVVVEIGDNDVGPFRSEFGSEC